jgi:hypothetical protein
MVSCALLLLTGVICCGAYQLEQSMVLIAEFDVVPDTALIFLCVSRLLFLQYHHTRRSQHIIREL